MSNSKANAKGNAISNSEVSISLARAMADLAGYSDAEIKAGTEFFLRKSRASNPPGQFDRAGRFFAEERTEAVRTCRSPSRAYPWPEMHAARSAAHCAEVFGVPDDRLIAVRRFAKAVDRLIDGDRSPESAEAAARLFKKKIKKEKPEVNLTADCSGAKSALEQVKDAARRMVYDNEAAAAAVRLIDDQEPLTRIHTTVGSRVVFIGTPRNAGFERRARALGGSKQDEGEWLFPEEVVDDVVKFLWVNGVTTWHRPPFAKDLVPVEVPSGPMRRVWDKETRPNPN